MELTAKAKEGRIDWVRRDLERRDLDPDNYPENVIAVMAGFLEAADCCIDDACSLMDADLYTNVYSEETMSSFGECQRRYIESYFAIMAVWK